MGSPPRETQTESAAADLPDRPVLFQVTATGLAQLRRRWPPRPGLGPEREHGRLDAFCATTRRGVRASRVDRFPEAAVRASVTFERRSAPDLPHCRGRRALILPSGGSPMPRGKSSATAFTWRRRNRGFGIPRARGLTWGMARPERRPRNGSARGGAKPHRRGFPPRREDRRRLARRGPDPDAGRPHVLAPRA